MAIPRNASAVAIRGNPLDRASMVLIEIPWPEIVGKSNGRGIGIDAFEIIDPPGKQVGVPGKECGIACADHRVDIADDAERNVGRKRPHIFEEPGDAQKIRVVRAGDDDNVAPARAGGHGLDRRIDQSMRAGPATSARHSAASSSFR